MAEWNGMAWHGMSLRDAVEAEGAEASVDKGCVSASLRQLELR